MLVRGYKHEQVVPWIRHNVPYEANSIHPRAPFNKQAQYASCCDDVCTSLSKIRKIGLDNSFMSHSVPEDDFERYSRQYRISGNYKIVWGDECWISLARNLGSTG